MIVPGGGLSPDGKSWIACKPGFFLPVRVLSTLFRRLMLEKLAAAHAKGKLCFFGDHQLLSHSKAFAELLAPLRKTKWFVCSKKPLAGPGAVLAYLSRCTHRVAIANSRMIKADKTGVTFKYKDDRVEGPERFKTMTLGTGDFIRRFLLHVLPKGLHRIRHYGLLANGTRVQTIARIRDLLMARRDNVTNDGIKSVNDEPAASTDIAYPCPCCGGRMIVVETFEPGIMPRPPPGSRHGAMTGRRP